MKLLFDKESISYKRLIGKGIEIMKIETKQIKSSFDKRIATVQLESVQLNFGFYRSLFKQ